MQGDSKGLCRPKKIRGMGKEFQLKYYKSVIKLQSLLIYEFSKIFSLFNMRTSSWQKSTQIFRENNEDVSA